MAEISNRAVATAAAGAVLAVGLAFVGKADAREYDRAVRCGDKTVRCVGMITRSRDGVLFSKLEPAAAGARTLRLAADRRSVYWRNAGAERSTPLT